MAKITRKEAAMFLSRVPEEKVFRCHDSCVMADMKELANALETMSDDTYLFHANDQKNDFATWVADVMGDQALAAGLRKAAGRLPAARMAAERASFLGRRAG